MRVIVELAEYELHEAIRTYIQRKKGIVFKQSAHVTITVSDRHGKEMPSATAKLSTASTNMSKKDQFDDDGREIDLS